MLFKTTLTLTVIVALGVFFNNYLKNKNEFETFSNLLDTTEDFENDKEKPKKHSKQSLKPKVKSMDTQNDKVRKEFYQGMDCPVVYQKNGDFMVVIKPRSCWAKKYNKSGELNYGKNRVIAREIYLKDFPKCPLPRLLRPGSHTPNTKDCPFVVQQDNPCLSEACEGYNWNQFENKKSIPPKCRRQVIHYCTKNANLDPACICWRPEYKDTPACKKKRANYYDAEDYNCQINVFDIETHPDMKNYIRKDKIPCWGCNVK